MEFSHGGLLLGVDGGGQTTQAIITSADGAVTGRGLAPQCNHHRVGFEAACAAVKTAVDGAFSQLAIAAGEKGTGASWTEPGLIQSACFGLAGINTAQDQGLFGSWLMQVGASFPATFTNDAELLLGAGTPEGWGVALVSGAGSVAVGRTPYGRSLRVGGWGHLLGDEGAGHQIAVEALKLATQAADRRGGSPVLLKAALSFWNIQNPADLIAKIYRADTSAEDIAGFAVRVLELAGRRDPHACLIADRAAKSLALHIDTVVQELKLMRPPVAMGGATMRASLKRLVLERVTVPLGESTIVMDPLRGAVTMARRLARETRAA
jgi:N-acetylmuramic acid 6-phosphate etherase